MTFAALVPLAGKARRITFDADDSADALGVAVACGAILDGEAIKPEDQKPIAYDLPTTRRLLGNVSRGTIYNWSAVGRIERVPNLRTILFTAKSVDNFK